MTTITDKKQYPGEQYLNELITNIEFAARAPVEVVRAMAAELQKRREADSAEPASNHEELPLDYLQGQKDGLEWAAQLAEANHPQTGDWLYDDPVELAKAIRKGPDMPEAAGNSPVIPGEVLSAILKVARVRADFDDFDGDRRGIGDCLDEAEQELIVTINKYASQLAAEPIATNDVREQTAVPPVPVIQADVAQAIEKLKRKLVECNRYNYCADAVKGVEYACHAAMLQGSQPVSQTYKFPVNTPCQDAPAHIWLQTAGVWPEDGELSELTWCSHNQHHDDTLYVRADLVNGNSPVTPDGWISCSERMPEMGERQCYVLAADFKNNYPPNIPNTQVGVYGDWFNDGNPTWDDGDGEDLYLKEVTHWMPLPEPPQEVNRG